MLRSLLEDISADGLAGESSAAAAPGAAPAAAADRLDAAHATREEAPAASASAAPDSTGGAGGPRHGRPRHAPVRIEIVRSDGRAFHASAHIDAYFTKGGRLRTADAAADSAHAGAKSPGPAMAFSPPGFRALSPARPKSLRPLRAHSPSPEHAAFVLREPAASAPLRRREARWNAQPLLAREQQAAGRRLRAARASDAYPVFVSRKFAPPALAPQRLGAVSVRVCAAGAAPRSEFVRALVLPREAAAAAAQRARRAEDERAGAHWDPSLAGAPLRQARHEANARLDAALGAPRRARVRYETPRGPREGFVRTFRGYHGLAA